MYIKPVYIHISFATENLYTFSGLFFGTRSPCGSHWICCKLVIMIDIEQYRARIGYNALKAIRFRDKTGKKCMYMGNISKFDSFYNIVGWFLYFIFIIYLAAICLSLELNMSVVTAHTRSSVSLDFCSNLYSNYLNCIDLVKHFYVIIVAFVIRYSMYSSKTRNHIFYRMYISNTNFNSRLTRLDRALQGSFLWMSTLNFLLIAIVNPSLLNPGPASSSLNVSVFYLNVQGLIPFGELKEDHPTLHTTKIHELNLYLERNRPDIVIYNETWLKSSISDNEVLPTDNYKVFRLDRSSSTHPPDPTNSRKFRTNGGGVLIGIRHDLDLQSKLIPVKCKAEILSVELTDKQGHKSILSTLYRVGTLGSENHNRVDQYLRNIRRRRNVHGLFLVGDLNMPNIDWEQCISGDRTEQLFLDTFSDLALSQVINHTTHRKGNILDVILSDKPDLISNINVDSDSGICGSDHYSVHFKLKLNTSRKKSTKRTIYNFKRSDWEAMNSEFLNTNWNSILSNQGMDEAWLKFKTKFFEISDNHIPKIKINDGFQPPWFDSEAYELSKKKQRLHKKWKKSNNDLHYVKFSECRKQFKNLMEKKLEDNFQDEENRNHITKKFWSYVKSKSNCHRLPEVVSFEDRIRSNPKDQCDLFNEYFFKQFSEPSSYDIEIDYSNDHLYRIDFAPEIIKNHLLDINPNKAHGPDLIHGKVLKKCANGLAYPLSFLFQLSYSSGKIPTDWKLANVVPIHKKGSKSEVSNYRPISLTSLIMKLCEKVIRDELLRRCNHLIDQRQHGFLAQKSCCTQMVQFCDSLALSLNDNIRSDVIYFDFQKAFDSVNHDLILKKLKYQYKIDGSLLRFFVSYLKDRFQRVVIRNEHSSTLRVTSGVPQGSILGPSIFILFLNDITEGLSPGTNIAMYADDTKIWRRIITADDHWIIQRDIDYLHNWANANKMIFHPSKCKALAVSNGHRPDVDFIYTISDRVIEYSNFEKDLGIHVNGKLNWTEHSEILYSRANQRLGLLKRTCSFVRNTSKRRALYLSQVRSQFEHCPIVWRPSSKSILEKLETIQKRALKWVIDDAYVSFTNICNYYKKCKEYDLLPMSYRFDFKDLMFFHAVFYSYSVVKFPTYLKPFAGSRLRNSHYDRLSIISNVIPRIPQNLNTTNSCMGISKSFFYRAHLAWNRLPLDLRDIAAPGKFKKGLLKYIWSNISDVIKSEYETQKSEITLNIT